MPNVAHVSGKYPFPPTTPNGLRCQKVLSSMADRGAGVALLELDINGLRAGVYVAPSALIVDVPHTI